MYREIAKVYCIVFFGSFIFYIKISFEQCLFLGQLEPLSMKLRGSKSQARRHPAKLHTYLYWFNFFFFFETNGVYSNLRNKQHSEPRTLGPGDTGSSLTVTGTTKGK
jgi:hypothetical protein